MKLDKSSRILKAVKINPESGLNKIVKAVILNFDGEEIAVKNDNFGTSRKYMDFTNGKKEAGLHPLEIVFSTLKSAQLTDDKFIGSDDKMHSFNEVVL